VEDHMRDHRFTASGVILDPIVTEAAIFNINYKIKSNGKG
jgi:hypothetical protein